MMLFWRPSWRRNLGRVATHCLACDDVTAASVHALWSVQVLYVIPLGRPVERAWVRRCAGCRQRELHPPGTPLTPVRGRGLSLEELVERTAPDLPERYGRWLADLDALGAGTADAGVRSERTAGLLRFLVLRHEAVAARRWFGRRAWASLLLIPVLPVFASMVGFVGLGSDALGLAFGLAAALACGVLSAVLFRGRHRRALAGLLTAALRAQAARIDPPEAEVAAWLKAFRQHDAALGRAFDAPTLRRLLGLEGSDGSGPAAPRR